MRAPQNPANPAGWLHRLVESLKDLRLPLLQRQQETAPLEVGEGGQDAKGEVPAAPKQ